MVFQWTRCLGYLAAGMTALSMAACGSSSVESALHPSRIIAFGDGQSDIGQSGSRFTVNGVDSISNWTEQVVSDFGHQITPVAQGGLSYAQGNSRIVLTPDAAGDASTPTLATQIDSFLGSDQFGDSDLVLISSGTSDIIVLANAARADQLSREDAYAQAREAGEALTTQVQRLMASGAQHIAVIGTYNIGESIWARAIEDQELLRELSRQFNEGFKISMHEEGYGNEALYLDFEYYINNIVNGPRFFGIDDIDNPVCTSIDPGAGIGIGPGQVSSALCDTTTLVSSELDRFTFADAVYLTPTVHRQFGSWAYHRIRDRW